MATQTKAPPADPTVVDPKHYNVELENEQVRVLRISYGPGENSVMHSHPAAVAVCLTDAHVRFGRPDGTSQDAHFKAGQVMSTAAEEHLPQNVGDRPFEILLIELKR
jgi:quercetin dioxygenase-like cupin family protein